MGVPECVRAVTEVEELTDHDSPGHLLPCIDEARLQSAARCVLCLSWAGEGKLKCSTGPIVKSLILSVVVFLLAFALTYLPIVAFMTLFSGPLSFILAVPVVLSEGGRELPHVFSATQIRRTAYIVSLFLARTFYIEPALEDTFDSVLLAQGHEDLVSKGRQIKGKGATKSLGRALSRPLRSFSPQAIARYLISLPLNVRPL